MLARGRMHHHLRVRERITLCLVRNLESHGLSRAALSIDWSTNENWHTETVYTCGQDEMGGSRGGLGRWGPRFPLVRSP